MVQYRNVGIFHEFVTKVRNQKKIIRAIADDRKFRNKIGKLDQIMDLLLMGVDNRDKAKGKRKKK